MENQIEPPKTWQLDAFTNEQKQEFCNLFAKGQSLNDACVAIGISRATYEYHLRQDRWFKACLRACRDVHCDDLEAVMLENGRKPQGFADRAQYLKAYRPDLHSNKHEQTPIAIQINFDPKDIAEVERRRLNLGL